MLGQLSPKVPLSSPPLGMWFIHGTLSERSSFRCLEERLRRTLRCPPLKYNLINAVLPPHWFVDTIRT